MTLHRFSVLAMAKEPVPGRVKTRLTPPFTPHVGAYLYEAMLSDTIDVLISLKEAKKYLFIEPQSSRYFDKFHVSGITIFPQSGRDLGEKMLGAVKLVMAQTGLPAIIVGTDIPLLRASTIINSVSLLSRADVVLGPCDDGGYYLIGLKKFTPLPFLGVPWSTDRVLRKTVSHLRAERLSYALTEKLFDIDTAGDIGKHINFIGENRGDVISRTRFSRVAMKLHTHLGQLLEPGT